MVVFFFPFKPHSHAEFCDNCPFGGNNLLLLFSYCLFGCTVHALELLKDLKECRNRMMLQEDSIKKLIMVCTFICCLVDCQNWQENVLQPQIDKSHAIGTNFFISLL